MHICLPATSRYQLIQITGKILLPTNSRPRRPHANLPPPLPVVSRLDRRSEQQLLARHGIQARNNGPSLGSEARRNDKRAILSTTTTLVVLPHSRPSPCSRHAKTTQTAQDADPRQNCMRRGLRPRSYVPELHGCEKQKVGDAGVYLVL